MNIAILGIRGIPSSYGGFETFIGELAPRLVKKGHVVTVYCRRGLFIEKPLKYQGVHLKYLASLEHKTLSTLSHSLISIIDASFSPYDLIFVVNAGNGIFGIIPRFLNKKCVLNVNGMEWLRPKWNRTGRLFFKTSAWLGTKFYNKIVTDAEEMYRLYARDFGINTTYIAYGANLETSTNPEILDQYALKPCNYYLIASRLIPDNNADIIIDAFVKSNTQKILAIAGGAQYKGNSRELQFINKLKSLANRRVKFLGHISKPDHIKELHCNCFAYIHGHQHGGINPALLKALGYGNLVLALNTPFNAEVLENGIYGTLFRKDAVDLSLKMRNLEEDKEMAEIFRLRARERVEKNFTWEKITDQYEALFFKIISSS